MDRDSYENNTLDLSDTTDESSSSSKSGLFQGNQPFVLDLHDIKKDEPAREKVTPGAKGKKNKRRGRPVENKPASNTSSSASLPTTEAAGKEEFYDADGSFHDVAVMDRLIHRKTKNKKPAPKPKTTKKRQSDGPTCSKFLTELSRKLALKKRQEEESPKNIVETIIESITNALPVKFSKKSPSKRDSPMKIETLKTYAPELLPNDTLSVPPTIQNNEKILPLSEEVPTISTERLTKTRGFRMPKMPLVSSEVFKQSEMKVKVVKEDVAVNTGGEHDVASEIAKHVGTLRKISLIAEEFNQKTAKNLKEIVDSVQADLLKKLEEAQAEHKASILANQMMMNEQKEPQEQAL
ncbi:uncharacterized protein LOC123866674 [Maniola jurtina]|uniref:uncharacterized protein LOC123866674 n=1 Tax=Maniola jurtina TaxID=191418 RepID=UPI001E687FFE|nr:uncharacterized protein LOC123866674 [Maniola jurtina]